MSGDHEDADPQMELPPEDDRQLHGEYPTLPNLPSLRMLNPGSPTSGSIVTIGPYQDTVWPNNSFGAVPEEAAAAAAPEVVISVREQAPDAAADANVVDRLIKGPPLRSVSSVPSPSSNNHINTRSVSFPSHQIQCKEGTIHPVEDLSNQTYAEVKGINDKLFRKYYKDIQISDDLIPERYKVQYDIVLLYADDDLDEAMAFRTLIEQFGITDTGERPKVCTLDYNPNMLEGSQIRHVEDAICISTLVLMFITKKFCEDRWAELQKDECLMTLVNDPEKKWHIKTVLTQKSDEPDVTKAYKIPIGLRSAKTINIFKITQGGSLDNLTEKEIMKRDRYFLKFLNETLSNVLPIRKAREKQVANDREKFIMEKKRRLALEEAQRLAEEDARRFFFYNDVPLRRHVTNGHAPCITQTSANQGTNHDQEKSGFSQYGISSTGRESSSSHASASNSVEIPNASHRTTHRRTAKGSPTEDDSGNNLPKLYVSELNNSYPGRNTGDIDTSEDPHKNESSHTEDPPSISERIVIGQEHDSVTLGTNSGLANSVVSSQPGVSGAGSNNDSQKLSVTEKKEAQSKFDQNHSDEPADSNVNSNPDTMDLSGCNDVPEMPETLITENFVASFSEVDTQSIKSQTVVQGGVPPAPYMASLYDREPSMNSEKSESSLASLFDYVNQQKRELWPTTPSVESASRSICESGAIPSTEIAGCLNSVDEFTAFVEGENRDMERPRPIQQIQLNAFTEMDGVELPSGLWSICYAYPHHIDSSYPLGRSILTSIKAVYRHQEDDEDLD